MIKALAIHFFALSTYVYSQNLITNGDFESYSACPTGGAQLTKAIGWTAPPSNDAEYFNSCSTDPYFSVPNQNNYNYQLAHSGNAYAGIFLYNGVGSNYREYLQKQFTSTMLINTIYHVVFYVNQPSASYEGKYAINNIALSFQTAYSITNGSTFNNVLNYTPNIFKFSNPIIKDSINWVKIEGVYQATGNENYIVIGNFKNDNLTDTIAVSNIASPSSYYFIDDVSVTNITTPQWLYNDTTITIGDSVLIGPAITGLNVDWFTMSNTFIQNAPGIYVKPIVNTSYKATETFNSATYNHTVNVTVLTTGIKEQEKLNTTIIYPNPNNGTFTLINSNGFENVIATLFDINGKLVSQHNLLGFKQTIIYDELNNGIYFLELKEQTKKNKVYRKVIIQK